MKTYYAVTAGDYSAYYIVTITDDEAKAKRIALAYDGEVELFRDGAVDPLGTWFVAYGESSKKWRVKSSLSIWNTVKNWEPNYSNECSKDEYEWSTYVHAEDKDHALKIAQDKYAQWKAEQEGIA